MTQRLKWLDYAKGIGIFLVVLGHTLRGLVNSSILESSTAVLALDRWIYAFHMPLFFFLSGLFIERSASKPFKDFVIDKLKTIAYPYLLWSLLQSLLQIAVSRYTNSQLAWTNLWRIIYEPVMQFWFLYTLFVIMLVYAIARKLRVSQVLFLSLCLLLYTLQGYVGLGPWGVLYLIQTYALYLGLGALVASKDSLAKLRQCKISTLQIVTIVGFLTIGLAVGLNMTEEKWLEPAIALCGICATLTLAMLLEQFNVTRFVEQWGRLSLEIYVAHTIASSMLRIALQHVFGFTEPMTHLILGTGVGIYAPIALETICQRIKFRYMFTLRLPRPNRS